MECPWNHEHSRDHGAYIIQYDNGKIIAGCHHDSCKEQGVSWESLRKMMEGDKSKMDNKKDLAKHGNQQESQADILINKLNELGHEYFHNDKGDAFVQVHEGIYSVNYPVESEIYQMLITKVYYDTTSKSIRKDAVKQVIDTLKAKACFDGKTFKTFKRFAMYENKLYYLVADKSNTILCISINGIETCTEPPVRLIKKQYMLEQPMPIQGEPLPELMRKYYHLETKDDEILHDVILVTRLITNIEQPIVIYTGPKGSFKTTSMDMDKRLLDYSSSNVSLLPKNEEDFILALNSQDIKCFDNIDNIGKAQADVFCQILSNSTSEKRKKYTDSELIEINIKSTVYMTAINLLSGRTDFLSRCIVINTAAVEGNMKSKSCIMKEFEEDKPYFLHGIFTTLSTTIKIFQELGELEIYDRLVDFIRWGYAVAEAIGYGGKQFLKAYENNRKRTVEEALAEDEVARAVMLYLNKFQSFSGSMAQFSGELINLMSSNGCTASGKIKSPIHLSRRLGELESELNMIGIKVDIGKKNGTSYVDLVNEIVEEQNKMIQVPKKRPTRKPIRKN